MARTTNTKNPFSAANLGFEVALGSARIVARAISLSAHASSQYRQARFGVLGHVVYALHLVDADALQEMHVNINIWTDGEVMAWKQSQLSTYNAIVIASTIFASIGITSLLLPDINSVHWTARAFCSASMGLGILSVVTATAQYQTLVQLVDALEIRLWLSRGRPDQYFKRGSKHGQRSSDDRHKYAGIPPFEHLPLESSLSALKRVTLPRNLLDLSVIVFMIGFALYWLFMWLEDVEDGGGIAARNIFILFILAVGLALGYTLVLLAFGVDNRDKKFRELGLRWNKTGEWGTQSLRDLRKELNHCQESLNSVKEDHSRAPEREPSATDHISHGT